MEGVGAERVRRRRAGVEREPEYGQISFSVGGAASPVEQATMRQHVAAPALLPLLQGLHRAATEGAALLAAGAMPDTAQLKQQAHEVHAALIDIDSHGSYAEESKYWMADMQRVVMGLESSLDVAKAQGNGPLGALLRRAAAELPAPCTAGEEGKDVSDSSCGSSTCGSSVVSNSSAGSTGRRLVVIRSRLSYSQHWAKRPCL